MFPEPMIQTVLDVNSEDRSTVVVTLAEWLRSAEDWNLVAENSHSQETAK